jgi:hypothetical protein
VCFDSRGGLPIALSSFPGLPICLRRQSNWASLVRLSESIVAGGSVTIFILPYKAVLQGRGFKPNFQMIKEGDSTSSHANIPYNYLKWVGSPEFRGSILSPHLGIVR